MITNGILIVAVANKDEPEPLSTKEWELQFSTLITVTEKLWEKWGFWIYSNFELGDRIEGKS